jgi:predicted nucleic acid-binding protein
LTVVLVDSSVWIEAARKDGDLTCKVALEALLEEFEASLCGPVRLEVLGGARKTERRSMEAYFSLLPYQAIEEADWKMAIRHGHALRDAGLTIPWNDVLVGTLSLRLKCRVYAKDSHFESMKGVIGIDLYEPGPGGSYCPARSTTTD